MLVTDALMSRSPREPPRSCTASRRRPSGVRRVALANLDIFEKEDLSGTSAQTSRVPCHPGKAHRPADRRRCPGRRVLLRHRDGQGQGDPGDVRRRRVGTAAARFLSQALSRPAWCAAPTPRRPGDPALPPLICGRSTSTSRADPARSPDRGWTRSDRYQQSVSAIGGRNVHRIAQRNLGCRYWRLPASFTFPL